MAASRPAARDAYRKGIQMMTHVLMRMLVLAQGSGEQSGAGVCHLDAEASAGQTPSERREREARLTTHQRQQ